MKKELIKLLMNQTQNKDMHLSLQASLFLRALIQGKKFGCRIY